MHDAGRIAAGLAAAFGRRVGLRLIVGRGPPAGRRVETMTQDEEVLRCATAADEILRLGDLHGHPDLVVRMGAQMVVELQREREIIRDRILDRLDPPRVWTTAEVQQMAHDIADAPRDEAGLFDWTWRDAG